MDSSVQIIVFFCGSKRFPLEGSAYAIVKAMLAVYTMILHRYIAYIGLPRISVSYTMQLHVLLAAMMCVSPCTNAKLILAP
jgi:hypothetical protein